MAESADVLSGDHQQVILPDLAAGCSMSDMAEPDQLEQCWSDLEQMGIRSTIPVTYINSAAAIKAFCGERGGVVCTSSNAAATLKWAWERGERILFLPDQHLGRNTAYKLGIPLDDMLPISFELPAGAVLVVSGFIACFAGYRLFKFVVAVYGFILGAAIMCPEYGVTYLSGRTSLVPSDQ